MHQLMAMIAVLLIMAAPALAQEHAGKADDTKGHAAELNKQFSGPGANVDAFVKRFESESREIFARHEAIAKVVGLQTGQAVADVGAGTGLFSWTFARQVGQTGKVYAVDVSPPFLKYLDEQTRQRKLENVVKVVRGAQETINLTAGSVDAVFVCATYHHFEHPMPVLASIHKALRPGGRLVVVDWDLRPDSSEEVRAKARAPREVYFREIEAAGFRLVPTPFDPPLKDNFLAVFTRQARTASAP
jgi:predicted methyltransferase